MSVDKNRNRPLKRPTVEIAAARNVQVLQKQQLMQRTFNFIAVCAVLTAGYFFAGVGLVVLILTVLAGIVSGLAIKHWRLWGERYRLMNVVVDSLEEQEANALRVGINYESRIVIVKLIIAVVSSFGIVVWVATKGGRWWVVLLCIIVLTYILSCIKILVSETFSFLKFTSAAQENDCRIALFRSFEGGASLARSALAPILAGYGRVDIVLDEKIEDAVSEGVFGGQVHDISKLCKVHRFSNAEWKDRVEEIIKDCDIAVIDSSNIDFSNVDLSKIDLSNIGSSNIDLSNIESLGVIWELVHCYKYLPPYRIYLAINAGTLEGRTIRDYVIALYYVILKHPKMPKDVMPKNVRPYAFLFSPNAWQQEALANDIHRKMCEIIAIEEGDIDASLQYGES